MFVKSKALHHKNPDMQAWITLVVFLITLYTALWPSRGKLDAYNKQTQYSTDTNMQSYSDDVLFYWDFSGSGNTIVPSNGQVLSVQFHGAGRSQEYESGALTFNGKDNYVSIGDANGLPPAQLSKLQQGSISVWFKIGKLPEKGEISPILVYGSPSSHVDRLIIEIGHGQPRSSGKLFFTVGGSHFQPGQCYNSFEDIVTDQWYHFAAVVGPGYNTGFLNGEEIFDRRYSFGNPDSSLLFSDVGTKEILWIGKGPFRGKMYYFDGNIDEITIFSRPLNAEEIREIYLSGA